MSKLTTVAAMGLLVSVVLTSLQKYVNIVIYIIVHNDLYVQTFNTQVYVTPKNLLLRSTQSGKLMYKRLWL